MEEKGLAPAGEGQIGSVVNYLGIYPTSHLKHNVFIPADFCCSISEAVLHCQLTFWKKPPSQMATLWIEHVGEASPFEPLYHNAQPELVGSWEPAQPCW